MYGGDMGVPTLRESFETVDHEDRIWRVNRRRIRTAMEAGPGGVVKGSLTPPDLAGDLWGDREAEKLVGVRGALLVGADVVDCQRDSGSNCSVAVLDRSRSVRQLLTQLPVRSEEWVHRLCPSGGVAREAAAHAFALRDFIQQPGNDSVLFVADGDCHLAPPVLGRSEGGGARLRARQQLRWAGF